MPLSKMPPDHQVCLQLAEVLEVACGADTAPLLGCLRTLLFLVRVLHEAGVAGYSW